LNLRVFPDPRNVVLNWLQRKKPEAGKDGDRHRAEADDDRPLGLRAAADLVGEGVDRGVELLEARVHV